MFLMIPSITSIALQNNKDWWRPILAAQHDLQFHVIVSSRNNFHRCLSEVQEYNKIRE